MSQTQTAPTSRYTAPRLVRAYVSHYDEKGYGFAIIEGEHSNGNAVQVFFHKSACRKVTGTADEPKLTREQDEQYVSGRGRNPSRLVMLIVPNDKGRTPYRAISWGVVPKRDWRADLINLYGGLDRFIGGEVSSKRNHGHTFQGPEYRGILASVDLTVERVIITIKNPRQRDANGFYVAYRENELVLSYKLDDFAHPDRRSDYSHYAIVLYEDNGQERRLGFSMPTERPMDA